MHAAFAPEAAFLVAAEWRRRIELVIRIRPNDACAQLRDHLENLAAFVRPYARAQAVRGVIRALDRFVRRAKSHHAQHRPEDFLLRHAMTRSDPRDEARRKPVTLR